MLFSRPSSGFSYEQLFRAICEGDERREPPPLGVAHPTSSDVRRPRRRTARPSSDRRRTHRRARTLVVYRPGPRRPAQRVFTRSSQRLAMLRRVSRSIGVLYLLSALPAAFSIVYMPAVFVVAGDAAATARKITDAELVYRIGILSGLVS